MAETRCSISNFWFMILQGLDIEYAPGFDENDYLVIDEGEIAILKMLLAVLFQALEHSPFMILNHRRLSWIILKTPTTMR